MNILTYSVLINIDLLKSLLALCFKFNYINILIFNNENYLVDNFISKEVLIQINDIQRILAYNCQLPIIIYDSKHFYGFPKYELDLNDDTIQIFLDSLTGIDFDEPTMNCDLYTMLLGDIIMNQNDISSDEISAVLFHFECGEVSAKQFFVEIEQSHDLEVIYWYMKAVYNAIMQIIFLKINIHFGLEIGIKELSVEVINIFEEFNFLFSFYTGLVPELVNGFYNLNDETEFKSSRMEKIKNGIELYLESIQKDNHLKKSQLPFVEVRADRIESTTIDEFMFAMAEHITKYKCFVRLFESLNTEYTRYYSPLMNKIKKINSFMHINLCTKYKFVEKSVVTLDAPSLSPWIIEPLNGNIRGNQDNCNYLKNMYQFSYEHFQALSTNSLSSDINTDHCKEVGRNLYHAIYYISFIITKNDDMSLLEITYNLISVELFTKGNLNRKVLCTDLERLLCVIITQLNSYMLEYCTSTSSDYNPLLIDDEPINPINTDDFLKKIDISAIVNTTLPNLDALFNAYENTYPNIKAYDNVIQFYWNGECKSISQIFANLNNIILGSSYIYAFYDIYFKFFLAVIYYETKTLFNTLESIYKETKAVDSSAQFNFKTSMSKIINKNIINDNFFPEHFKKTIDYYHEYCLNMHFDILYRGMFIGQGYKIIEDNFKLFGVEINLNENKLVTPFFENKSSNRTFSSQRKSFTENNISPKYCIHDVMTGKKLAYTKVNEFIKLTEEIQPAVEVVKKIFDKFTKYYHVLPKYLLR
ncbi:Hypothetical protein CINCED_3A006862 [Cinara cedri]|nr:Hypothetical protein CINCED_3A006862 [Cinara cedri]